jgi:hypothetical protein
MRGLVGALIGAVVGAVLGFFVALVLPGRLFGNGQAGMAGGILGLGFGAPLGLLIGAVAGWLIARRTGKR